MARTRFQDRPLRDKLARVGFLLTATAMTLLLLAMLAYQFVVQRAVLGEEMRAHAEVIGNNSAAAIMFGDKDEAEDILSALSAIPDISRAQLALPGGGVFARYQWEWDDEGCAPRERDGIGWCSLRVSRRITLHGQFVGTAAIEASLASLYRSLALQAAFGILAAAVALTVSLALTRRIAYGIVRPLQNLVDLTQRVRNEHDFGLRAPVEGDDEAGQLARSFNDMMDQLHWHDACTNAELKQRRQNELQLNQIAYYDGVTGLRNRHYFEEKLATAVAEVQRCGTSCGLLFIDLDDFKIVNDTLGHEGGDVLLRQVAERLTATLRSSDVVCRIGGDEFAVILQHNVTVAQSRHVAGNIVAALTRDFVVSDHAVRVGASIGIALCPEHASNTTSLVRHADAAMYRAKGGGKNNYRVFRPELEAPAPQELDLEESLRAAVASGQLELRYQPLVELTDPTRLMGFEAVVRWSMADGGLIEPQDLAPAAERSGLADAIDDWAMRTALRQAATWQGDCPGLRIGIRLTRRQLDRPDLVARMRAEIRASALPARLVDLGLTKDAVLGTEPAAATHVLAQFRTTGARIVVDVPDGSRSMQDSLKRYPIDALKLDRGFLVRSPCRAADDNPVWCTLVAAATGLAIEPGTGEARPGAQADLFRHAGCRVEPGYLFTGPLDAVAAGAMAAAAGSARGSGSPRPES